MADTITEKNFREFARAAIQKYYDRDMLLDAMFWSCIIGLYEEALKGKKGG